MTPDTTKRHIADAIADAVHTLERLESLTPDAANARTARDLHMTVNAIASCAIARIKPALQAFLAEAETPAPGDRFLADGWPGDPKRVASVAPGDDEIVEAMAKAIDSTITRFPVYPPPPAAYASWQIAVPAARRALAVARQHIEAERKALKKADAEDVVEMLIERDAEADKLARQVSIMRGALAELGKQPWQRCPSTHCERSQECRSPHECSAVGTHLARRALDAAFRVAVGQEPDPFEAPDAIIPKGPANET